MVTRKVGLRRLLKLTAFMRTLAPGRFWYGAWATGKVTRRLATVRGEDPSHPACGTAACAGGWAAVLWPQELKLTERASVWPSRAFSLTAKHARRRDYDALAPVFGLSSTEVFFLFSPAGSGLGSAATAKQVAQHIENFVKAQS